MLTFENIIRTIVFLGFGTGILVYLFSETNNNVLEVTDGQYNRLRQVNEVAFFLPNKIPALLRD